MENKINFEGKKMTWEYSICPCLECPIYSTQKEWEEEARKNIRKDKCWTSKCTYHKMKAKQMAKDIYFIMNNYHCEECNIWISKEDIDEKYCPECGCDLFC